MLHNKIISRRLVRLALEMRDIAEHLEVGGFPDKADELLGVADMTAEWSREIVNPAAIDALVRF
jgi:hypothetical protein